MKRMVNGAVSDITQAFLGSPLADRNPMDFVFMIPSGSVILSNPAAVDLLRSNSTSLQLLPMTNESGRSTPAIHCTTPDKEVISSSILPSIEPLIEVSEEEEDANRGSGSNKWPNKEEKETQNYEKKLQNLSRSASVDNIGRRLTEESAANGSGERGDRCAG